MNADRLNEIRAYAEEYQDPERLFLLAALDAAEQRAADLERVVQKRGAEIDRQAARAAQAEQERDEALAAGMDTAQTLTRTAIERDEWQELATRLAEEAGVDAEQMLEQARAEAKL